ncbi:unnamed protein product [Orchesella dallaii]|uniref:Uncharacterized protein n=1 Tax=Orchesella dallaii TaxID=48710 RepID=A0ABP1QE06_9HEXA
MTENRKKRYTSEGIVLKGDEHLTKHKSELSQIHHSEIEMKNLEDGLPMKLMKFMGLPKSYRHTLYKEFIADVNTISSIPTETASSLNSLVSWICGKNEVSVGTQVVDIHPHPEEKETLDWAREIHEVFHSANASNIHNTDGKFASKKSSNIEIITPFSSHTTTSSNYRLCKPSHPFEESKQSKFDLELEKLTIAPAHIDNPVVNNVSIPISADENDNQTVLGKHDVSVSTTALHTDTEPELVSVRPEAEEHFVEMASSETSPETEEDIKEVQNDDGYIPSFPLESETNIYSFQYEDDDIPDETKNEEASHNNQLSTSQTKIHDSIDEENIHKEVRFSDGRVPATSETYIYAYQYDEELKTDDDLLHDSSSVAISQEPANAGVPADSETNIYSYQYECEEDDYIPEELLNEMPAPSESGEGPVVISEVVKCNTNKPIMFSTAVPKLVEESDDNVPPQLPRMKGATTTEHLSPELETQQKEQRDLECQIPVNTFSTNDSTDIENSEHEEKPLHTNETDSREDAETIEPTNPIFQDETSDIENSEHEEKSLHTNETDSREDAETIEPTNPIFQDETSDTEYLTPVLATKQPCQKESLIQINLSETKQKKIIEASTEKRRPSGDCFENYQKIDDKRASSNIHIPTDAEIPKSGSALPSISASSHVLQSGMKSLLRPARKSSLKEVKFAPTCKDNENEFPSRESRTKVEIPDKPKPTTSAVQMQLNEDLKTLEEIVKKLYKNLNKKGPLTIVANFKPRKDGKLEMDLNNNNLQTSKTRLVVSSTHSLINSCSAKKTEDSEKPQLEKEDKVYDSKEKANENESVSISPITSTYPIITKPSTFVIAPSPTPTAPINVCAKPIKSALSFKSKQGTSSGNKTSEMEAKMDGNNNIVSTANTGRPTKRVSLDLCSLSTSKSIHSKAFPPDNNRDGEKIRPRQQRTRKTIREDPPSHAHQPCYANKADTISIKAHGGCQLHPESQTNLRVIRKCNSHTMQFPHPKEEQHVEEPTSDASTSDVSSLTSEAEPTGKNVSESKSSHYSTTRRADFKSSASSHKLRYSGEHAEGARTIKTKVYIPSAPASQRKTSYRDIFREKRNQQQTQTVYVDLTSKGKRGPQTLKSRSIHLGSKNPSDAY